MPDVFIFAIRRSTGFDDSSNTGMFPDALISFDVEDDGSIEWNYTIDLLGVMGPIIEGRDVDACLRKAVRIYANSMFNSIARRYGAEVGGSISVSEVKARLADDPAWLRVLNFIASL
jgi:hypothetical protein